MRLPKDCRFNEDEVMVNRIGNMVMLLPKDDPWSSMMAGLSMFTDDFMIERPDDAPPQERDRS